MGSIEQREQAIGWLQRTFAAWRAEASQQQNNNIMSSPRRNTKRVTRGTKAQQQQRLEEVEVRKETPVFRDTPRGRRCKDFTDDAGYLRSEWARLRLAMLRDSRERHKHTTQQQTTDSTTRPGTSTSAAQPNAPSEYTARRGEIHSQARIGLKLMRIIEGDRDRRKETEDHG